MSVSDVYSMTKLKLLTGTVIVAIETVWIKRGINNCAV